MSFATSMIDGVCLAGMYPVPLYPSPTPWISDWSLYTTARLLCVDGRRVIHGGSLYVVAVVVSGVDGGVWMLWASR